MTPLITLLTDFGTRDTYVAEVKGAVLGVIPDARFVDITHDIPQGDTAEARYALGRAWHRFPDGTVHLVVVDPGVGTSRRALAATSGRHGFVAPDNGVLTPVLDNAEVVALTVPPDASATFHGRDVFAPAAARLLGGTPLAQLGLPVTDPVRVAVPAPQRSGDGWVGIVVHVDRFGNLITNLRTGLLSRPGLVSVRGTDAGPLRRTFGDVEEWQVVAYEGSDGAIEIAVRNGSAKDWFKAGVGSEVVLRPGA
jgi:S-adenosyl-L-methionine hydrolase (adenosine-forming)